MLYSSTGILRYALTEQHGFKLVAEIDPELARYYRALIPKWIDTNPQKYRAHISAVRKETPVKMEHWERYEGQEVEFLYSPIVHHGEVYWWLNCFSKRLEEIRLELGLPVDSPYTRPPDGMAKTFHTTIGNMKRLQQV
jgi:hypothetical protein